MNYLLDVNVLVAWGWSDHVDHLRVVTWIRSILGKRSHRIMTSAIPELGFVRVSVQRGGGRVRLEDGVATLDSMVKSLGSRHRFVPDDLSSILPFPSWCEGASRSMDAHLLRLAERNGLRLATLDGAIPGAFLIPPLVSRR